MASEVYIAIAIAALAVIAAALFFMNKSKKNKKMTPLAGLAFAFVVAGIVFGDDRTIGYSLMAVGIAIAAIDIIQKRKK